MKMIGEQVRI